MQNVHWLCGPDCLRQIISTDPFAEGRNQAGEALAKWQQSPWPIASDGGSIRVLQYGFRNAVDIEPLLALLPAGSSFVWQSPQPPAPDDAEVRSAVAQVLKAHDMTLH